MRTRIAIIAVTLSKWLLSLLGRGGSLPGAIALKIDPDFLSKLIYPEHVVLVSGTNGKTTTANQLYEVLSNNGWKTISNLKGDNMKMGIVSLIGSHTGFDRKVRADAVVLEIDELNIPLVIDEMKVSALIMNNLFRDQGDRLGSVEALTKRIGDSLRNFSGLLVLNGNDANVSSLKQYAPHARACYFGVGCSEVSQHSAKEAGEGKFCPSCKKQLSYTYYNYAHMGEFICPDCGFGNFDYAAKAENIQKDGSFTVNGMPFTSPQNALYAIYNCCAIIAYTQSIGICTDVIVRTFASFEFRAGRTETINVHGKPVTMMLIKNPAGANETMKYIEDDKEMKDIVIIVNDAEGDGRDVSWYWDADFERIMQPDVAHIICSGLRAYDMALRFFYSGYEGDLQVIEEPSAALERLLEYKEHAYVMANYTALAPTRALLERKAR